MAKNSVNDYDTTAGNNTDVGSVNIAEGCAPSGINNAIRALMGHLATALQGGETLTGVNAAALAAQTATVTNLTATTGSFTSLTIGGVAPSEVAYDSYASQAQAEGGTATGVAMSPLLTGQAITALVPSASTSAEGIVEKATAAEVVSATADKYPDAASIKYNEGVCKAWVSFTPSTGAVLNGFNVTSVTRNALGKWTINWAITLDGTAYCVGTSVTVSVDTPDRLLLVRSKTATTTQVTCVDASSNALTETEVTTVDVSIDGTFA